VSRGGGVLHRRWDASLARSEDRDPASRIPASSGVLPFLCCCASSGERPRLRASAAGSGQAGPGWRHGRDAAGRGRRAPLDQAARRQLRDAHEGQMLRACRLPDATPSGELGAAAHGPLTSPPGDGHGTRSPGTPDSADAAPPPLPGDVVGTRLRRDVHDWPGRPASGGCGRAATVSAPGPAPPRRLERRRVRCPPQQASPSPTSHRTSLNQPPDSIVRGRGQSRTGPNVPLPPGPSPSVRSGARSVR
jgi:hypothetical protein